jgi:hypothetical protein
MGMRFNMIAVSSVLELAGSILRMGLVSAADTIVGDEKEVCHSWLFKLQ